MLIVFTDTLYSGVSNQLEHEEFAACHLSVVGEAQHPPPSEDSKGLMALRAATVRQSRARTGVNCPPIPPRGTSGSCNFLRTQTKLKLLPEMNLVPLLFLCSANAFHVLPFYPPGTSFEQSSSTGLLFSKDWDAVVLDDEDDEIDNGPPIKPDMRYLPRNVMRQNQNFVAIREAGGKEVTNDIYVREPKSQVFWFVGKVARVSDVSLAQAVARQWNIIETYASNLRPLELFPGRGRLEIWTAPGDSELEVAYNNPDLLFVKMEKNRPDADSIKNSLVGFQGEVYDGGEEGFRTWRNDDGSPARPPMQSPGQEEFRPPTEEELFEIQEKLKGQDINEIYEEQQRRLGIELDE